MKKILSTLFAASIALCAAAVPTYTVNPASDTELASKSEEIVFTFSEPVKVDYVDFIGGQRFNNPVTTRVATGMTAPSTTVTVKTEDSYWGESTGVEFLLEVYLPVIYNAQGVQIMDTGTDPETKEEYELPFTANSYYSTPDNNATVEYLGYSPTSGDTSVWNVYMDGWGAINFIFSGEVSTENASAFLTFILSDSLRITQIATGDDLVGDWDFWTGNYVVTAYMYPDADITEENLIGIMVSVDGIKTTEGDAIAIDPITYTNTAAQRVKSSNTAGMGHMESDTENYTVFSVSGTLVGENMPIEDIKTLPSGLYIVNGKKYIVK